MKTATILGIGGAGAALATAIHAHIGGHVLLANTRRSAPTGEVDTRHILLGPEICHGQSAGGTIMGRRAAEASRDTLAHALEHAQFLVIALGLGGGTGTGALPVVLELARRAGLPGIVAASLPMAFETERRLVAQSCLDRLQASGPDPVIVDLQQVLMESAPADQSMQDLLDEAARSLARQVSCRLESNPSWGLPVASSER